MRFWRFSLFVMFRVVVLVACSSLVFLSSVPLRFVCRVSSFVFRVNTVFTGTQHQDREDHRDHRETAESVCMCRKTPHSSPQTLRPTENTSRNSFLLFLITVLFYTSSLILTTKTQRTTCGIFAFFVGRGSGLLAVCFPSRLHFFSIPRDRSIDRTLVPRIFTSPRRGSV